MSHSLPVAPPPLPDNSNEYHRKTSIKSDPNSAPPAKNLIDECLWAIDYPELQKACFLARVCQMHPPKQCRFLGIPSILQAGPTCGLTALSMLLCGATTSVELLATAKEMQYTNNGEMFSAQNLYQLICDNLKSAKECECQLHEGRLNCTKVRECLLTGSCIFVPYDPDYNHAPCLKYGHKAHWALIIGYLISEDDEFFVLARHGKAKNIAVWSLSTLSDSNANLVEFAQPKGYPDCDFLLPPGGIGGNLGLRERAIIVHNLPHKTIAVRC